MRHWLLALLVPALLAFASFALADKQTDAEKAKLAKLEKTYTSTKAAYAKKPKDAKAKDAYVKATVTFGTATMNSPILAPREKYPKALRLYREALKVDPKNPEALKNKKLIEDIYKSMGRPVPS